MKLLTLAVLAFSAATVNSFMVPHAQPIRSTASKMVTTSSRVTMMGRKAARAARLGTWAAETKAAAERKAAGTTQKKKKAAARVGGSTAKKSKPAPAPPPPAPEPVAEEPAPAVEEAPAPAPEPEPEPAPAPEPVAEAAPAATLELGADGRPLWGEALWATSVQ